MAAGSAAQVDPMSEMNQQLAQVNSVQALQAVLYPAELFKSAVVKNAQRMRNGSRTKQLPSLSRDTPKI